MLEAETARGEVVSSIPVPWMCPTEMLVKMMMATMTG